MIKILVTNIILYNKNYLKLPIMVIGGYFLKIREWVIEFYFTFSTVTVRWLSVTSTIHSKLSPASTSSICAMDEGMLVLILLEVLFAGFIFDVFLRIIIPPFIFVHSNKYVRSIIYNYPIKLYIDR